VFIDLAEPCHISLTTLLLTCLLRPFTGGYLCSLMLRRRRDATVELSRVGVGSVYYAFMVVCGPCKLHVSTAVNARAFLPREALRRGIAKASCLSVRLSVCNVEVS